MKKFLLYLFLICAIIFQPKVDAIEEKKSIAVFPLDTAVSSSSYSIYSAAANMFAADLVNSLQEYDDTTVVDVYSGKKILASCGLGNQYEKLVKEYKKNYTIDYEKAEKIASAIGVSHIAFVYGGFDTQKQFLKTNWKYKFHWIWASPIKSSAQLNINTTLIDVKNHNYVLEENAQKDFPMENFQEPSQSFGENIIPISEIKKFTKPTAEDIAQKIHSELYPDINQKYAEKETFIDKFKTNDYTESLGGEQPTEETNPVLKNRKNNYKKWIEENL